LKVKIEVFLEQEESTVIEQLAEEKKKYKSYSRSAWIRDAVLEKLEREGLAVEYRNNKVLEGK
jgi:hypothetical protein